MAYSPGDTVLTKVVGVTFDGRQAVIKQMTAGEMLLLKREPYNRYDTNAIRVERLNGSQIGYLSKDLAQEIAAQFDHVEGSVKGKVIEVVGGYEPGYSIGLRISFLIPGKEIAEDVPLRYSSKNPNKAVNNLPVL
jgi:single-stranded-DNA-specific exonuclease